MMKFVAKTQIINNIKVNINNIELHIDIFKIYVKLYSENSNKELEYG